MKVLLLSPHIDDIELGAGGTLIKLRQDKNNSFCWAVFSMCEDAVQKVVRRTLGSTPNLSCISALPQC
ncbi:hypothetical protein ES703_53054 [subsurface metagenome]